VQLLDILLRVVPECVVLRGPSDHGDRILQGYLGLLNVPRRHKDDQGLPLVSTQVPTLRWRVDAVPPPGVDLSAASKLLILNSLNTFLEFSTSIANTTHPESDQEDPWFLVPFFATETAYQNFIRTIQPLYSSQRPFLSWQDRTDAPVSAPLFSLVEGSQPWSAFDLDDAERLLGSLDIMHTACDYPEMMSSLARSLQPTLTSTFLDNAPAALAPSLSSSKSLITEIKLVHVVGRLARALYLPILRQSSLVSKGMCKNANILMPLALYFRLTVHPVMA
jgi:hypothetical protein